MSSTIQHQPEASRFIIHDAEGQRALLEYQVGQGRMVIVHTLVPEALRGQGLAAQLVRAALDYAQANGLKVTPACAYAENFLNRHPEYAHLLI